MPRANDTVTGYVLVPTEGWDTQRVLDTINDIAKSRVGEKLIYQTPSAAVAAHESSGVDMTREFGYVEVTLRRIEQTV